MKSLSVTIQMKVVEQYFPVVLFIMLCKVVLTSVDEFVKYDHSNQRWPAKNNNKVVSKFAFVSEHLKCNEF